MMGITQRSADDPRTLHIIRTELDNPDEVLFYARESDWYIVDILIWKSADIALASSGESAHGEFEIGSSAPGASANTSVATFDLESGGGITAQTFTALTITAGAEKIAKNQALFFNNTSGAAITPGQVFVQIILDQKPDRAY